jgi:hypothetical protein
MTSSSSRLSKVSCEASLSGPNKNINLLVFVLVRCYDVRRRSALCCNRPTYADLYLRGRSGLDDTPSAHSAHREIASCNVTLDSAVS